MNIIKTKAFHLFFISFLFVAGIRSGKAQMDEENLSLQWRLEYRQQGAKYMSYGMGLYKFYALLDHDFLWGYQGIAGMVDIPMQAENFHLIPKITSQITFGVVNAKLSVGMPTDFQRQTLMFTPEIGLTYFGGLNLNFGWNFPMENHFDIYRKSVSLEVTSDFLKVLFTGDLD